MNHKHLKILAFFILIWPLIFSGLCYDAKAEGNTQNESSAKTFELQTGEKVSGEVIFESAIYYRLKLSDGTEKIVFKDQIASTSETAQAPIQEIPDQQPAPSYEPPLPRVPKRESLPPPPVAPTAQTAPVTVPATLVQTELSASASNLSVQDLTHIKDAKSLEAAKKELVEKLGQLGTKGILIVVAILIGIILVSFFIWGLVIKICVHLVGGKTTIGRAILFQIKMSFSMAIIGALCAVAAIICLKIFPLLIVIPILLMLILPIIVYFAIVRGEFGFGLGQAILFTVILMVLQVGIGFVFGLGSAFLVPHGVSS